MEFTLHFDLTPVAKERPRMRVVGMGRKAIAIAYTPAKTKNYEKMIRQFAADQMAAKGMQPISSSTPLEVLLRFDMPRSKANKDKHHTKTPDLDNLVKAFLDGIQGAVFEDDKSIVEIRAKKYYAESIEEVGVYAHFRTLETPEAGNGTDRPASKKDAALAPRRRGKAAATEAKKSSPNRRKNTKDRPADGEPV